MADAPPLNRESYLLLDIRHRIAASLGVDLDCVPEVTRPDNYDQRAASAVAETQLWLNQEFQVIITDRDEQAAAEREENDGYPDSDDEYQADMSRRPGQPVALRSLEQRAAACTAQYLPLLNMLPICEALDLGFHLPSSSSTRCYCPFGRNLEPWRTIVGLADHLPACAEPKRGKNPPRKAFDPVGLRSHLCSNSGPGLLAYCRYHDIVRHYLGQLHPIAPREPPRPNAPSHPHRKRKARAAPRKDLPSTWKRRANSPDSR
jgi:hypothetical protein